MPSSDESRDRELGLGLLEVWANNHPYPDKRNFFVGSEQYSPRQILHEARLGTEIGIEHVETLLKAYRKSGCKSPEEFAQKYIW